MANNKPRFVDVEFNIADRGRKQTGIDRSRFDYLSAIRVINSDRTKEKLAHGDLFGYLGHAYRMAFGLDPQESVVTRLGVKVYQPAFLITAIEGDEKTGMVYHRVEFCDTENGDTVRRLQAKGHGGFSSVFRTQDQGMKDIALEFYGFDYVYLVNYSSNRAPRSQAQMDSAAGTATKDMVMFGEGDNVLYFDSCGSMVQYDTARQIQAFLQESSARENQIIQEFTEAEMNLEISRQQAAGLKEQLDSAAVQILERDEIIKKLRSNAAKGRSSVQLDSGARGKGIDLNARRQDQKLSTDKAAETKKPPRQYPPLPSSFTG